MATKNYTETEIKSLVLDQMNKIKGLNSSFTYDDSGEAFDSAVRECGFELPATTDANKDVKYQWLIQRQRRWYLGRLYDQYILRFDAGELKAQQIAKNLSKACTALDEAFGASKSDPNNAHLFYNAATVFGTDIVLPSGFVSDRVGQDTSDY